MFRRLDTHIHFVGIGGIGMSGIAEVLLNLGYEVTGTDLAENETTRRLSELGASIHRGHDGAHIGNADVVVISSAVKDDNPEVVAARERRIPVIPRAEMLAELMRLRAALLIAGSHGKTTTTSLLASALHHAGVDPTVVIGGKVNVFGSNARLGHGEFFVAEADESDGSFLMLTPTVAVITNIDREHMDHYGSDEALLAAFVGFANRVPFYGAAIVCIDDERIREILPRLNKRTVTFGLDPSADYVASKLRFEGAQASFEVHHQGEALGEYTLAMPGEHNVRNALATIAVCENQKVDRGRVREAISQFSGVQRRFTLRGEVDGIQIVDDYGHHPTEIRATISGARTAYPDARIIAIMQPHRYTRLRDHFDEFATCMRGADQIFITDVHAAGESPIDGIDGRALADATHRQLQVAVEHVADYRTLPERLGPQLQSGDLVLTLGAGSITHLGPEIVEHLRTARTPVEPA